MLLLSTKSCYFNVETGAPFIHDERCTCWLQHQRKRIQRNRTLCWRMQAKRSLPCWLTGRITS